MSKIAGWKKKHQKTHERTSKYGRKFTAGRKSHRPTFQETVVDGIKEYFEEGRWYMAYGLVKETVDVLDNPKFINQFSNVPPPHLPGALSDREILRRMIREAKETRG